jgi:hypothetical protein
LTCKKRYFIYIPWLAGIAQLVEYKLPKLGVASSNLVARSTNFKSGNSSEPNLVK